MAKVYGKRIAAKLTGDKQTTIWISGKHLPMVKDLGVSNQKFAQTVFDVAMGFVVNINMKTGERKIIDPTGQKLSKDDENELAKMIAAEIVRNLNKGCEAK